jgi:hypothetical protein
VRWPAALLLLLPAPAAAQTSDVDLTCRDGFIHTTCTGTITRQQQPDLSGFGTALGILIARGAKRRAEKKAEQAAMAAAAKDDSAKPGVIERLRAGDCHGAIDYAVAHGTLSLAGEVADYCQTIHPVTPD